MKNISKVFLALIAMVNLSACEPEIKFNDEVMASVLDDDLMSLNSWLEKGGTPNARNEETTALHLAVQNDWPGHIILLLHYGANHYLSNSENRLALSYSNDERAGTGFYITLYDNYPDIEYVGDDGDSVAELKPESIISTRKENCGMLDIAKRALFLKNEILNIPEFINTKNVVLVAEVTYELKIAEASAKAFAENDVYAALEKSKEMKFALRDEKEAIDKSKAILNKLLVNTMKKSKYKLSHDEYMQFAELAYKDVYNGGAPYLYKGTQNEVMFGAPMLSQIAKSMTLLKCTTSKQQRIR